MLSELTEYMVSVFPGDDEIDWTLYQQRRSLVRVLQHLRELGCLKINDGREQNFSENVEAEVLYESTGLSRYFLPSFSADITAFHSGEQFLQQEWGELAEDRGLIRRHRVYRKLLLSPAVYAQGADDLICNTFAPMDTLWNGCQYLVRSRYALASLVWTFGF